MLPLYHSPRPPAAARVRRHEVGVERLRHRVSHRVRRRLPSASAPDETGRLLRGASAPAPSASRHARMRRGVVPAASVPVPAAASSPRPTSCRAAQQSWRPRGLRPDSRMFVTRGPVVAQACSATDGAWSLMAVRCHRRCSGARTSRRASSHVTVRPRVSETDRTMTGVRCLQRPLEPRLPLRAVSMMAGLSTSSRLRGGLGMTLPSANAFSHHDCPAFPARARRAVTQYSACGLLGVSRGRAPSTRHPRHPPRCP